MSTTERVCPRCGTAAVGTPRFCSGCGLDLASQYELPTREEWEARQRQSEVAESQPPRLEPSHSNEPSATPAAFRAASPVSRTSSRDVLIGIGGVTFSVGQSLAAAAALIALLDTLHSYLPAGLPIGHGLDVLAQIAEMAGVAVLAAGFFVNDDRRWSRLATGALLVALGATCESAGAITIAVEYLVHHVSGELSASAVITALAAVMLAIGATLAGRAFRARRANPAEERRRDRRLIAGTSAFVGSAALTAAAAIPQLVLYSGIPLIPGGYTTALGFEVAAEFIIAAGLVVGVVAFCLRDASEVRRIARRDNLLWIAIAVALVGFVVQFIAGVAGTSAGSGIVIGGKELTAAWLTTFQAFANCGALVCAGAGFFLSARARG